jgi:hypothetical protein
MRPLLTLISLFLFLSCGTRKTSLEVSKSNVGIKQSSFEESKIKNDVTTKAAVSNFNLSWDNETLKNSNAEIDVEETFDKEGNLTGRKTKARFNNSEHKKEKGSTAKSDSSGLLVDRSKSDIKKGEDLNIKASEKDKAKVVDADKTVVKNVGGPVPLIIVVSILAVIAGIVFLLHKKKLI